MKILSNNMQRRSVIRPVAICLTCAILVTYVYARINWPVLNTAWKAARPAIVQTAGASITIGSTLLDIAVDRLRDGDSRTVLPAERFAR